MRLANRCGRPLRARWNHQEDLYVDRLVVSQSRAKLPLTNQGHKLVQQRAAGIGRFGYLQISSCRQESVKHDWLGRLLCANAVPAAE